MLNLLRFKGIADYPNHPNEATCSGAEAYQRYSERAVPLIEKFDARVVFSGPALASVIGPTDEHWDKVLLVEYPSIKTFIDMASSAEYAQFAYHRTAAVEDSRLIPIQQ
ncbi:MAG: DUF1330 domain-containing protein, partial [Pseudomonadota bacterium]